MSEKEKLEIINIRIQSKYILFNVYIKRAKTIKSDEYSIKYYKKALMYLSEIIRLKELERRCVNG